MQRISRKAGRRNVATMQSRPKSIVVSLVVSKSEGLEAHRQTGTSAAGNNVVGSGIVLTGFPMICKDPLRVDAGHPVAGSCSGAVINVKSRSRIRGRRRREAVTGTVGKGKGIQVPVIAGIP